MPRKFATLKVRLPKKLRAAIKRKLKRASYASASEYVCDLIRKDLHAESIKQVTSSLNGVHSASGTPAETGFWRELHFAASGNGGSPDSTGEDRQQGIAAPEKEPVQVPPTGGSRESRFANR
jgi:Arc/MetJ-type ribon-helix-helix transcriptional regulator